MATPRKPLGRPLPRINDDFIFQVPSNETLDKYAARWNAYCLPKFRGLLNAKDINDKKSRSRIAFDAEKMQYTIRATGEVLPRSEINKAFLEFIRRMK